MNDRGKTLVSLSTLALLGITMTCDAVVGMRNLVDFRIDPVELDSETQS